VGKPKKASQIICFCNNVSRDVIEAAITKGCQTLNEIYDQTTAGVGPCGGSCRRKIAPFLEVYLATGKFPAAETEDKTNPDKPEVRCESIKDETTNFKK
jgi:bacterioferritin-associated ferredoxin